MNIVENINHGNILKKHSDDIFTYCRGRGYGIKTSTTFLLVT